MPLMNAVFSGIIGSQNLIPKFCVYTVKVVFLITLPDDPCATTLHSSPVHHHSCASQFFPLVLGVRDVLCKPGQSFQRFNDFQSLMTFQRVKRTSTECVSCFARGDYLGEPMAVESKFAQRLRDQFLTL